MIFYHPFMKFVRLDLPSDQDLDPDDIQVSVVQYNQSHEHEPMPPETSPSKSKDICIIDLSQLGDQFSVPVAEPLTKKVSQDPTNCVARKGA